MKLRSSVIILVLLAAQHVVAPPAGAQRPARTSRKAWSNDAVERWVRDNYAQALDLALPGHCASATDARWIACVHIVPAFKDEMEYSLAVERRQDGSVIARLGRPKAKSVYEQLRKLKKKHPKATAAELAKRIKIESRTGDSAKYPGLEGLAAEFENVRLSPVLSDEIMMDATQYVFRVRSFAGDQMELRLHGAGPAAPRQPQGLIQWAESVREMVASAFH